MLFLSSDLLYYTTSALKCQYIETAEKAGQFPDAQNNTSVLPALGGGERKNDIKAIPPPNGGKCRKKAHHPRPTQNSILPPIQRDNL